MVERITEERLVDLRIAHAECEPDDQCDGADLLAEVDRLRADVQRLREQNKASSDAWTRRVADMQSRLAEHANLLAMVRRNHPRIDWMSQLDRTFVLDVVQERDRLAGVIEQIRALAEHVEQCLNATIQPEDLYALLPSPTDGSTDDG